jgi:glycosyltransferase involved in cell wall biosynthesis
MEDWITCQLGAREHYAVPRALQNVGSLHTLCTDIWAGGSLRRAACLFGRQGRSIAGRHHPQVPDRKVLHWTSIALSRHLRRKSPSSNPFDQFISEGQWFGGLVRERLKTLPSCPGTLFSYDTSAAEPFLWGKQQGLRLILDQIDPGPLHYQIVAEETERWPGWEIDPAVVPDAYHDRRRMEWDLAHKIIVNSRWSQNALLKQGVDASKLVVVPLVFERSSHHIESRRKPPHTGPLRVLFLGKVNLAKGVPYLIEAARLLGPNRIEVTFIGSVALSKSAIASAPSNVRFIGLVSRVDVACHYQQADVFVLPTLSDGFGITQLEAMSNALPVIATPNCGDVVTDGVDGLIVPVRDSIALASALDALAADREALSGMASAAVSKSRQFTIDCLSCDLLNLDRL